MTPMNYRQTAVTVIMLIFFPFYGVCWLKAYPGIVYPQCGKRFFGKGGSFGGARWGAKRRRNCGAQVATKT